MIGLLLFFGQRNEPLLYSTVGLAITKSIYWVGKQNGVIGNRRMESTAISCESGVIS